MHLILLLCTYFISFTDKAGSEMLALSDQALAQRARWEIAVDSLDYAVSPLYLDSVKTLGAKVLHTSRWFNGATVEMDSLSRERIAACRFVRSVELTRNDKEVQTAKVQKSYLRNAMTDYPESDPQQETYNLQKLHEAGFEGQGIRMAIIDVGFQNADSLTCFQFKEHFLGSYDLTDETSSLFDETGSHGGKCLSIIAARTDDYHGAATAADYYLIRSEEHSSESPKEMDNLVTAFELADSLGANIISTSLGYFQFDNPDFNLTYSDLDGKTVRASFAATIAARKGILVCCSAGNEGNKAWHYISPPADADSILSVGAVDLQKNIAAFSSFGPSYDGRVKPEVCAVGQGCRIIDPADGSIRSGNGTSFACPMIAGMAACLWSALPEENAMQIRERIIRSADHYLQPDERYGYGIPDAWVAYTQNPEALPTLRKDSRPKARVVMEQGQMFIEREGVRYSLTGIRQK